jgi:hypothetical protein
MPMMVRLKHVQRTRRDRFRVTLDLIDPERPRWAPGDCTGRVDVVDAPRHEVTARGLLKPALELYRLCPEAAPETADSRLLWDMGEAVHAYVERLFEAGVVCPFAKNPGDTATERTE